MALNKRAQSMTEYITLVVIIIGAFVGIGSYFKRGLSGRWKAVVDELGDQYDPRVTNGDALHTLIGNSETSIRAVQTMGGIWTMRDDQSNSLDTKTGTVRVGAY